MTDTKQVEVEESEPKHVEVEESEPKHVEDDEAPKKKNVKLSSLDLKKNPLKINPKEKIERCQTVQMYKYS